MYMIENENQKLDDLIKLTRENNEILHGMRRHQRFASFVRALYWVVIIGVSVGSYYLVQPYFKAASDTYQKITGASINISDFDFSKLFSKQDI